MKKVRLFGLVVFVFAGLIGCSNQKEAVPDISRALPYEILDTESYPAPEGKGRYKVIVYSRDAKTKEQRAQTAIKAAVDFQREKKAYEVLVWLEALPKVSERLAIADYYPYKESAWGEKKTYIWSVEASRYEVKGHRVNSLDVVREQYLRE